LWSRSPVAAPRSAPPWSTPRRIRWWRVTRHRSSCSRPGRPHVDVALIEAEEQSSFSTSRTPDMLNKLRVRGAEMGCDAVVIGGMSSRDPGIHDAESWLVDHPKGRKGVYATCIMYTQPLATADGY
jgi:hypothetical protein